MALPLFELTAEDLAPTVDDDGPAHGTHAERAARFDARNPHVYRSLVKVVRFAKERGLERFGISAAFEVVRFEAIKTVGSHYKLNNNHKPYYAREIMRREPDLEGIFEVRKTGQDPSYRPDDD